MPLGRHPSFCGYGHEAIGAIRLLDGGIGAEGQGAEHRRDDWGVKGHHVEHRVVSPIVHGIEEDFKLDRLRHSRRSRYFHGHQPRIVDECVLIDEA